MLVITSQSTREKGRVMVKTKRNVLANYDENVWRGEVDESGSWPASVYTNHSVLVCLLKLQSW